MLFYRARAEGKQHQHQLRFTELGQKENNTWWSDKEEEERLMVRIVGELHGHPQPQSQSHKE